MENQNWLTPVTDPAASRHYVAINSELVLENLLATELPGGIKFELREVQGPKSRKKFGGKHIIRLKTNKSITVAEGDEVFPEVVITNSYNRTSPFKVEIGLFRLVCTNGLVIKTRDFGSFKCRHMGDEARTAQEIVLQFVQHLPNVIETQKQLMGTEMSEDQAIDFALKAAQLRWEKTFSEEDARILLEVARPEDEGMNAWAVFNRVQEKLMNGGYRLTGQKRQTRTLTNVGKISNVNTGLFDLVAEVLDFEMVAAQ